MIYLITYELKGVRRVTGPTAYQHLEETIVSFGNWWHYISNTWLVDTNLPPDQMVAAVRKHLSDRDYLLVIAIQPPYQGWLPKDAWEWLNNQMSSREGGGVKGLRGV